MLCSVVGAVYKILHSEKLQFIICYDNYFIRCSIVLWISWCKHQQRPPEWSRIYLGPHKGVGGLHQGQLYQHRVYSKEAWRRERCAFPLTGGDLFLRWNRKQAHPLWILSDQSFQGQNVNCIVVLTLFYIVLLYTLCNCSFSVFSPKEPTESTKPTGKRWKNEQRLKRWEIISIHNLFFFFYISALLHMCSRQLLCFRRSAIVIDWL